MGNYRGRIDIIADILRVAEERAKKTRIMYRANLSYKVLQKYLAELTYASLIAYEVASQCYLLTEKGREYLTLYKEYSKANRRIERRLTSAMTKKENLYRLTVCHKSKRPMSHQEKPLKLKNKAEEGECYS